MPFDRVSFSELKDRIETDINTHMPGADSRLRRSPLSALANGEASLVNGLYGFLDWVSLQVMIDTAESEWLDRWAVIWGVTRKPSTAATGTATATGNNGTVIPADTILQADGADGIPLEYKTTDSQTIAGGTATLNIEAVEPGAASELAAGSLLTFATPIAGVSTTATVIEMEGGADGEDDESFRERLLERIRRPPHGGSENDYVQWALEVPGVTRAWVVGGEMGLGTVTVRFMMDEVNEANDGFPQGDARPLEPTLDIKTVQDYLDSPARKPITADVWVVSPIAAPLDVTIADLVPNTAEMQAEVIKEIDDMITREGEPGGTIYVSKIWEAASIAAGEQSHKVVVPADDVTHTTGQLAILGTVTFT